VLASLVISMDFRILGALEVVSEGHPLPLGGGKQRALLALLLLHPNEAVSVDRLVDDLWGERPPPTAAKNVQVYVSHLRRALGDDVIVTTPPGYAVRVAEGELDADRAAHALAAAAGRPAPERRELLAAALAEWRGSPLADLADVPSAHGEIGRLEELRLQLLARRLEADLELGRHAEILVELERLVAAHPLDERLRAQLMLALYRSGRQADALEVYRDARRVLTRELGLEPDEVLRSLEQRILAHDPTLQAPPLTPVAVAGAAADSSAGTRDRRLPRSIVAGAGLIVAAAAAVAVLALARDESPAALDVPPNSVAVVDAEEGVIVAAIPVGRGPEGIVGGAGAVWVTNVDDRTLSRIDPATLQETKVVGLGFEPTDLAADDEHVWVAGGYDHVLWRVDRDGVARLKQTFTEKLGPLPEGYERGDAGIALHGDSVWLSHGDEATELDPDTGALRRTIRAGGRWHKEIAASGDRVWVGYNDSARPADALPNPGIDPIEVGSGRRLDRAKLISNTTELVLAGERLWAAIRYTDSIWQLDPASGLLQRTLPVGGLPEGLVYLDDALWVTSRVDAILQRVDAGTGEIELVIPLGHQLGDVAAADGRLWVAVRGP
jgi:DNA-binding SARP family transcriptional activator/streptogramin lyase